MASDKQEELKNQGAMNDEFIAIEMAVDATAANTALSAAVSAMLNNQEARDTLKKHLDKSIDAQGDIVEYLYEKGIYEDPDSMKEMADNAKKRVQELQDLPTK